MANLNRVLLMGNLTRDPELRYVPSGTAVTNFSLAVNRIYTTQSGEKKKDTCFVRIVVWGKMAETCGEFLSKGSAVFVEGRLQSRSWSTTDGQKRNTIEVVAQSVQFLDRVKGREEVSAADIPQDISEVPSEDISQDLNTDVSETKSNNNKTSFENPPF